VSRCKISVLYLLFLSFTLVNVVNASDESFADQFLGNPLLVLAVIIVVDIVALVYHKIRK
jgi:hypothetical protein